MARGVCTHRHVHIEIVTMCPIYIQDPVTVSEDCANGQEIRASYELSYETVNGTATCVVNETECSMGTCRYDLQNTTADSSCQRLFSGEGVTVSVTASYIVGRSNPAVSHTIGEFSTI